MFGKKYPPQQMIEEYSDDQSEPLVEEVDPDYEPTDKEIKEYALDTLGMNLPQDQNLLYLAREGLKAPIPPNWIPYQSRDGEIYYKHKITQEKIYDHPTDIEYRKKYEQQKEKMARTNLKSINMRQNMVGGLGQSGPINSQLSNINNVLPVHKEEEVLFQENAEMAKEHQKKLQELEKREELNWKEYQEEAHEKHQKKMKKIRQDHDEELDRFKRNKFGDEKNEKEAKINERKKQIKERIQENFSGGLDHELKLLEKSEEAKLQQYTGIYQEDHKIKINKLENQLAKTYLQKQNLIESLQRKNEEKNEEKKKKRMKAIQQFKTKFKNPDNPEIALLTETALKNKITAIKQEYHQKLKLKEGQLEKNIAQMRKMLGLDMSHQMHEMAARKGRMQAISQQKLKSFKNKEIQILKQDFSSQLDKKMKEISEKVDRQTESEKTFKIKEAENQLERKKDSLERQYDEKLKFSLSHLYEENSTKLSSYERDMNKKMSQLRVKFISEIENTKSGKNAQMAQKLLLKEKEEQIHNKEEILKNLQDQLILDKGRYKLLKFEQQIESSQNMSKYLENKLKAEGIQYKSPKYLQYLQIYKKLKQKYQRDKKILSDILKNIQQTAIYPFYEKNKLSDARESSPAIQGSSTLIKNYNKDVRKMRQNEIMLKQFEIALKKIQFNESQALELIDSNKFQYKQISLKDQFQVEEDEKDIQNSMTHKVQHQSNGHQHVQSAIKEHSKFLATVKNELNRKLYQIRSTSFYQY